MSDDIDVQIDFTDITMASTDGIFEEVNEIMMSEYPYNDQWMIRTTVSITSPFGIGQMILHFFGNRRVVIDQYNPSVDNVYYNPDVRALCSWCREAGWKIPQPSVDVVKEDKEFWKYFWDTLLIDSDYFDKAYGKRELLDDE